jgi:hypothetical protein
MSITLNGTTGITTPAETATTSVTAPLLTSPASTALTIQSAGTTAMTIDTSQNVGIGTVSPSQKLDVNGTILAGKSGTSAGYIGLLSGTSTNTGFAAFYSSAGTRQAYIGYIGTPNDALNIETDSGSNKPIRFATNATEAARIDTSGNLLVGMITSAVGQRFSVTSTGTWNTFLYIPNGNSGIGITNASGTATYAAYTFYNNGTSYTLCGNITVSGTSASYNTSSDYRLKENVALMTTGLATVVALKPVIYNWISTQEKGEGFIAHELAEVVPLAVNGEKDAVNEDGSIKPQGVDYSKIVVHLVAAIQELSAKKDALEARLVALEAK